MKPIIISIIVGVLVILLFAIPFVLNEIQTPPGESPEEVLKPVGMSEAEKQKIEDWIQENNLNQYGDSQGTMYTGGTPLFNEKTGKNIDKYEYITKKYPNKPWLK